MARPKGCSNSARWRAMMAAWVNFAAGGDPNGIVSKPVSGDDEVKPLETALIVAIKTKNEQMVQLLLSYGAEVHRPAQRGLKRTPLQQACEIGSFKIVKLLLD